MPLLTQNGNYLRVRGEYRYPDGEIPVDWELPPRARRILLQEKRYEDALGTTSACAENTSRLDGVISAHGNYLRVRGEYRVPASEPVMPAELPPRARRIQYDPADFFGSRGTTSACAENTAKSVLAANHHRNYLRVRGEYGHSLQPQRMASELPPRARRIQFSDSLYLKIGGTTSACAENTKPISTLLPINWNYLRVRGEYTTLAMVCGLIMELPPRARRIPHDSQTLSRLRGTTSACAENT